MSSRASAGLLALARLWISQGTGVLRGKRGQEIPMRRGGIVAVADLALLRDLVGEELPQLHYQPVEGSQDRAAVARLLVDLACAEAGDAETGVSLDAQALAPAWTLAELGVQVERPQPLRIRHDSAAIAAEHLGLLRRAAPVVRELAADPQAPMRPREAPVVARSTPPAPEAAPARAGPAPPAWTGEARLRTPAAPAPPPRPPRTDEVVAQLDHLLGLSDSPSFEADLACAEGMLSRGRHTEATGELVRLRERRAQDPRVLYLLVEARLGVDPDPGQAGIAELESWLQLADLLGGRGPARARAEQLIGRARLRSFLN